MAETPTAAPAPEEAPQPAPVPSPQPPADAFAYQPAQEVETNQPTDDQYAEDTIGWTASEFIAHQKNTDWYLKLGGVAVLVAAIIWLITKDVITSAVVLVAALTLGFYASRQPRELAYEVGPDGIRIGDKFFGYGHFRSFSVDQEGAFSSITLLPLKRFSPALSIYYAPDDEDAIIDVLELRLPVEEHRHDAIDRLMKRIRF